MPKNSLLSMSLADDERYLLRMGLNEWGGPADCSDAMAVAMGFRSVQDLFTKSRRLIDMLDAHQPLSRRDWARIVIATEIVFASDLLGSGTDWQFTTGLADEETIKLLRSVQGKVLPAIRRADVHAMLDAKQWPSEVERS